MLPSKGYFSTNPCPFFVSGTCERSYCHFRHYKKDIEEEEDAEEEEEEEEEEEAESMDTGDYDPLNSRMNYETEAGGTTTNLIKKLVTATVEQVLSRNDIKDLGSQGGVDKKAIVDDVVQKLGRSDIVQPKAPIPSYKPTPIAELNKRHIPVMHAPMRPPTVIRRDKSPTRPTTLLKYKAAVPSTYSSIPYEPPKPMEYVPDSSGLTSSIEYTPSQIKHESKEETTADDEEECAVDNSIETGQDQTAKITSHKSTSSSSSSKVDSSRPNGCRDRESSKDKKKSSSSSESSKRHKSSESHSSRSKSSSSKDKEKSSTKERDKHTSHSSRSSSEKSRSHKRNHADDETNTKKAIVTSSSKKSKSSHTLSKEKTPDKRTGGSTQSAVQHKGISTTSNDDARSKSSSERENHKKDKSHKRERSSTNHLSSSRKESSSKHRSKSSSGSAKHLTSDKSSRKEVKKTETVSPESISSSDVETDAFYSVTTSNYPGKVPTYVPSPLSDVKPDVAPSLETSLGATKESPASSHYANIIPVPKSKVRISHVPNVSKLLSAKKKILAATVAPSAAPAPPSPVEEYVPSPPKRIAHTPSKEQQLVPKALPDPNIKIPIVVRQPSLALLFYEYRKFCSADEARERALEEELQISSRVKMVKVYQSSIRLAQLRVRKTKGQPVTETKAPKIETKITSQSTMEYTYGLTLYECFNHFVMDEDTLKENGYPMELEGQPGCAYILESARRYRHPMADEEDPSVRICINCNARYRVNADGIPFTEFDCMYHWGRLYWTKGKGGSTSVYPCCKSEELSPPCTLGRYHVTSFFNEDCLEGFIDTRPLPPTIPEHAAGIYALDCEMCYTTRGLELTRITVMDLNHIVIYDTIVVPDYPILDYCTRFSGINEKSFDGITTRLDDVRRHLLDFIFDKTILVGHSLENDLKVLKILHKRVVDTSVVFPHKNGLPYKLSLKLLTRELLHRTIQDKETGHDSKEDAEACLDLMMHQIREFCKSRKPRVIISLN